MVFRCLTEDCFFLLLFRLANSLTGEQTVNISLTNICHGIFALDRISYRYGDTFLFMCIFTIAPPFVFANNLIICK